MKAQILKIAGVKSEKEFYKKYPSEEAFMKQHGKAFKKAQMGTMISGGGQTSNPKMLNLKNFTDQADMDVTGMTDDMRKKQAAEAAEAAKNAAPAGGGGGGGIGGMIGSLGKLFGGEGGAGGGEGMGGIGEMASSLGGARYGADIPRAQQGGTISLSDEEVQNEGGQYDGYAFQGGPNTGGKQAPGGMDAVMGGIAKYAGPAGKLYEGYQALRGERRARKAAEQQRAVSDITLEASKTRPEEIKRKYVRPEDIQNTGEEFFPIYGVGTNVLARNGMRLQDGGGIGGNPTEIQNTYGNGNSIYDDLGYEPLTDPNQVKSFYHGGRLHSMKNGGSSFDWSNALNIGNQGVNAATGGQNAGGQIGGTIGESIGDAIVPGIGGKAGRFIGNTAGQFLDTNAKSMKREQAATKRNITTMGLNSGFQGIQNQNVSYMENGGYMNPEYNPQVITMFGDHDSEDFADYAHKDQYRAGGHLKAYTPPSERAMEIYEDGGDVKSYGLGGELQTHWGGGAETMSYNPYLPGTGETVMFRGKSHEERSPNGETGIGVTYGGNPVEVERGEPMVELEEGGTIDPQTGEVQKSGVVFGNLKIPNQYIDMLGDKSAKGKKFKNYVADLSKIEERQNKLIEKSTNELDGFTPITSFDKLKMTALQANIQGANMKLKDIADKKINAASLQNAINDTAEERGLVADDLARGKVKIDKEAQKQYAKFGGKFTKAQVGINASNLTDEELIQEADRQGGELDEVIIRPKKRWQVEQIEPDNEYDDYVRDEVEQIEKKDDTYDVPSDIKKSPKKSNVWEKALEIANTVLPYLRPSDAEGLDMEQLYPEMYAMSSNQLEPVPAQGYQPDLSVPYDISFQDQLNANQADYRAAQRIIGYNPAAQANLNAQKYQANQGVYGSQFRANQEMRDKAYGENRNILNQAKLTNLGIFDKQYERQAQALSNTKATTQAALNSIADKYAKNKLENRTLGVMENMYNYRFDENGRVVNMNPLAQLNMQGRGTSGKSSIPEGWKATNYDAKGNPTGMKRITDKDVDESALEAVPGAIKNKNGSSIKKNQKNSSVVRAYKNI